MHGDDESDRPIADSAPLSAKLLKRSTLKIYKGFPHGMCTTQPDVINVDILAFISVSREGILVAPLERVVFGERPCLMFSLDGRSAWNPPAMTALISS